MHTGRQDFQEVLEEISKEWCDIIIVGDFYKNKLKSIINGNGLKQIMKDCTTITNKTIALTHYVITINDNILVQININNKIADHESIEIFIHNKNVAYKRYKK